MWLKKQIFILNTFTDFKFVIQNLLLKNPPKCPPRYTEKVRFFALVLWVVYFIWFIPPNTNLHWNNSETDQNNDPSCQSTYSMYNATEGWFFWNLKVSKIAKLLNYYWSKPHHNKAASYTDNWILFRKTDIFGSLNSFNFMYVTFWRATKIWLITFLGW